MGCLLPMSGEVRDGMILTLCQNQSIVEWTQMELPTKSAAFCVGQGAAGHDVWTTRRFVPYPSSHGDQWRRNFCFRYILIWVFMLMYWAVPCKYHSDNLVNGKIIHWLNFWVKIRVRQQAASVEVTFLWHYSYITLSKIHTSMVVIICSNSLQHKLPIELWSRDHVLILFYREALDFRQRRKYYYDFQWMYA